VTLTLYPTLA
jgi:hypothetical protein